MPTRSRGWCITINGDYEHYFEVLKSMTYRFLRIGAKEIAPTTGHEHYHAFIYFDSARTFASLKKKLGSCHIEDQKGTVAQAMGYTVKDGAAIFEDGEVPHQGCQSCCAEELQVMSNKEVIERYGKNCRTFLYARDLLNNDVDIDSIDKYGKMNVYFIWGPPAAGKSQLAKQILKKFSSDGKCNLIKYKGGFFEGVGQHSCAWFDEWRDDIMPVTDFLSFIDYNKQILNTKGGHVFNNYTTIVITSVQNPMEIYSWLSSSEPKQQWIRRMTEIIHLTPPSEELVEEINIDDL